MTRWAFVRDRIDFETQTAFQMYLFFPLDLVTEFKWGRKEEGGKKEERILKRIVTLSDNNFMITKAILSLQSGKKKKE